MALKDCIAKALKAKQINERQAEKIRKFAASREDMSEQDIIDYCRDNMAHFKAPKTVIFGLLPKTSTGKIQNFILRQQAAAVSA